MGGDAMLVEVETLPSSQVEAAGDDRKAQAARGQDRAHVRGHVVRAFSGVAKYRIAVGDRALHPALQVTQDLLVRVLAQDE